MKISMKNETEDKRYSQEVFIPSSVPDEYKREMYEQLQRAFGIKVFNILYQSRLPAVLDFKEETLPGLDFYEPGERVRYTLFITPVEHHRVTIAHYEPTNSALIRSATQEIKYRISRKIRSIFKGKAKP